jgi:ribose transport system substrate-binding protein
MRILAGILLTATLILTSCAASGNKVIGVVPKGASHEFWLTVKAGAEKAAAESGYTVEWNAPALEIDANRQQSIVESMVNRRLAGVALAPVDRKALASVVERGAKAGVPMVIYDSDVDTAQRLAYIATDNKEGGRIAARRLGQLLNGKGKVAVIGFMAGSASTMEREDGFVEEIRAKFPAMEMVGVQFGMANRAKAMAVTENVLTAHPDLAGLFADNESSSAGAVQALKSRAAKNVKLVAFDASDQLVADMQEGWIDSLVLQDPFRMGYESVKAITEKLAGREPANRLDLPATLITAADIEQNRVPKQLLPGFVQVSGAH